MYTSYSKCLFEFDAVFEIMPKETPLIFAQFQMEQFHLKFFYKKQNKKTQTKQREFIKIICSYLIFVIFFTRAKFFDNKIYTEKTRKLWQNTQKIANCLPYYGKIHSKLPNFCVKSEQIYTGQKKFSRIYSWGLWQIWGMNTPSDWLF